MDPLSCDHSSTTRLTHSLTFSSSSRDLNSSFTLLLFFSRSKNCCGSEKISEAFVGASLQKCTLNIIAHNYTSTFISKPQRDTTCRRNIFFHWRAVFNKTELEKTFEGSENKLTRQISNDRRGWERSRAWIWNEVKAVNLKWKRLAALYRTNESCNFIFSSLSWNSI